MRKLLQRSASGDMNPTDTYQDGTIGFYLLQQAIYANIIAVEKQTPAAAAPETDAPPGAGLLLAGHEFVRIA